jgi:hypothetical protein
MVSTYENFIYSFFDELDEDEDIQTELNRNYDLKIFKLEAKTIKKIKEHKKNLFVELINELQKIKKKKILIIDEIQTLQEIYMNGGKLLLNEFLNFCIRLTKETHLSHILILTSNTIFLNQIYNDAKMKVTSDFKLIDHLKYEDIKTWLTSKDLGFSIEEVELIYDYLGGSTAHIKKLIDFRNEYNSLEEQLEEMVEVAKNEIIFEKNKNLTNKEFELFLKIIEIIVKNKSFVFDENDEEKRKELNKIIDRFCNIEILFFDPIKNKVSANSKVYVKAFERIIDDEKV